YCQELNMIRQGEEDDEGNHIYWQLEFADDHYCIWLDKDGDGVIDPKEYAVDPVGNVDYKVRLDDLHLDSITLDPDDVTSIGFTGQGKPFYGDSVGVYDVIKFTLDKGGEQIILQMEGITGNVNYGN
ncbi:MAG: hypothetical protein U9P37_08125, partial [Pseudomonadota bacterium]|nr:hypothetical protein [Pseudomonadota bacterium]